MAYIDTAGLTTHDLEAYDDMMVYFLGQIDKVAPLAVALWSEVLRELDVRGRVKLVSGSYDDVLNANVTRIRAH